LQGNESEYKKEADDASSVDEWCKTVLTDDDSLLYYKAKNAEDETQPTVPTECFLLVYQNRFQREQLVRLPRMIFIDATHHIDIYGHQLFTIVAQDEYGHGVPVCNFITSAAKTEILEAALRIFKTKFEAYLKVEQPCPKCLFIPSPGNVCACELDFQPHYIMVDDDKAEQEAIRRVFKKSQLLLCHWHVNVNWWRNCQTLLRGDLKFEVFWVMKRLIRTTRYERFNEMIIELYERCRTDGLAFWDYFVSTYMGKGRPGNETN
jgi:MULE transposase domain